MEKKREIKEVLRKMLIYIKDRVLAVDWEFGSRRNWKELYKDDTEYGIVLYKEIEKLLSNIKEE